LVQAFLEKGGMKMGTLVTGAVVIGIIALALSSIIKDKKNGKSVQCGGECKNCGGGCH
jgi:hypothetical protein